jgi:protein-disulfide isomerase
MHTMNIFRFGFGLASLALLGACGRAESPAEAAATPAPVAAAPAASAPAPTETALPPELAARLTPMHAPVLGRADAPVTLVEFFDPACEACRRFAPVVKQVLFAFPEETRVVMRYAAFHEGSEEAIRILEAARKQNLYEPVLTAFFDRQEEWASHHAPNINRAWEIAREAGLNLDRARRDAKSPVVDAVLKQDAEDIIALQVQRTPTFYVNGKAPAEFGMAQLMSLVEREVNLAKAAAPATQNR